MLNGYDGVVQLLIKINANLNVNGKITHQGLTPTMLAAMKNQTNVLKVLIQNGSDINAKADYISTTALHEAAYKGHLQIVMMIIENGANINQRDEKENTPLIVSTEHNQPEVTKYLLEKGANLMQRMSMEIPH